MTGPLRVSDAEREEVAGFLRDRTAERYLSIDTFSERLDLVYEASSPEDLHGLVDDLPGAPGGKPHSTWHRLSEAARQTLRAATRLIDEPAQPLLVDPAMRGRLGRSRFTLGRSPNCDYLLSDPTASRYHAELQLEGERWILTDLRSTNGTYVNGRRVWQAEIGRGDHLAFGETEFVFDPALTVVLPPPEV